MSHFYRYSWPRGSVLPTQPPGLVNEWKMLSTSCYSNTRLFEQQELWRLNMNKPPVF